MQENNFDNRLQFLFYFNTLKSKSTAYLINTKKATVVATFIVLLQTNLQPSYVAEKCLIALCTLQ